MISKPLPPEVTSVALFGSVARGDDDRASDCDICVVTEDVTFGRFLAIKAALARHFNVPVESISIYLRSTVDQMTIQGSLFLHHLSLEARLLTDKDDYLKRSLQRLKPFTNYAAELSVYSNLIEDVRCTLLQNSTLLECDFDVLQMVVRNCCILLSYASSPPVFGRSSAYKSANMRYAAFPSNDELFAELTGWHLLYSRNIGGMKVIPCRERQEKYIRFADSVLTFTKCTVL